MSAQKATFILRKGVEEVNNGDIMTVKGLGISILSKLRILKARRSKDPSTTEEKLVGEDEYDRWVAVCDTLSATDRLYIRRHIDRMKIIPLISIVMPTYNTPERFLREAIESVRNQIYPLWELCIADDASSDTCVLNVLREFAGLDKRIKWVRRKQNGHISAATNSALALATGEFIALMDHDDILPEQALYEILNEINTYPDVDLIYTDEDHIDAAGHRSNAYFKTDWNRELFLGQNMISHFGVYRRSLVEQVGGMRTGFEGSQDYDLALRVADASSSARIRHIPAILYHWRQNSGEKSFSECQLDRCASAARRAVLEHLERRGETAIVEPLPLLETWQRVRRLLPESPPLVSLIIPTKDRADLLARCLNGLRQRTSYANIEIIVVDNESNDKNTILFLDDISSAHGVRILRFDGPFNYSAMNNAAVKIASGSIIGLINNDIDVIGSDWLAEMVAMAILPDVGAVGARLLYDNGRVQHAGVALGIGGVASHFCKLIDRHDVGYFGRAIMTSEVSAVTGACMVVKKSVYNEVGGLDEVHLPVAYNDVDFCLRIRERGYRNIYIPAAELYHSESVSRGSELHRDRVKQFDAEQQYMLDRWGEMIVSDPFYNPNLSLLSESYELAFPSRRRKPWL